MNYYTSITLLGLLALLTLCILIGENDRIKKEDKKLYYLTYILIALASIAEWTGLLLAGAENMPKELLAAVKCVDYILTPMAGGAIVRQISYRNGWSRALNYLLLGNTAFQIVACFGGWMIKIDGHNHYTHGPLYFVYMAVYLAVITIVIIEFVIYGKSYRKENRISLYAVMLLVVSGILIQEISGGEFRTSYISLTIGAILLYIHYSDFSRMASDDKLREQEILISTDALTGMHSRYAYAKALESFDEKGELPEDLCVFSIDINGLKLANDTKGHAEGDKLICGAAECIKRVFKKTGQCFRTGGDEFIVFAVLDEERAEDALRRLKAAEEEDDLNLAAGYAFAKDHPGISAEKLVVEADRAMYSHKNDFYRLSGIDRRAH